MIELVISVCMLSQPEHCKDVHLTYSDQNLTPYQCVMRGQPEMAKWIESHPKWRIHKWRCGRARTAQRDI